MSHLLTRFVTEREIRIDIEAPTDDLARRLDQLSFVREATLQAKTLVVKVPSDKDYRGELSQCLIDSGAVLLSMAEKEMSLEEAFVTITQENLSLFTSEEAIRE